MNLCNPPRRAIRSAVGRSIKVIGVTQQNVAPVARTLSGIIAFTVAAVPTGMKAGVRISPRGVSITPVLARPSVAFREKEKRCVMSGLLLPQITFEKRSTRLLSGLAPRYVRKPMRKCTPKAIEGRTTKRCLSVLTPPQSLRWRLPPSPLQSRQTAPRH